MRLRTFVFVGFIVIISGALGVVFAALTFSRNPSVEMKLVATEQKSPEEILYHYSPFSQRDFFEEAYANIPTNAAGAINDAAGLLVPHHLLAAPFIAEAFQTAASNDPKTIVLISPNHFFAGHGQITASAYDWQTPYGILESGKNLIRTLETEQLVTIDETPFEKEHGIYNLVGFIKKSFPNSVVIPLIVKDTISAKTVEQFSERVASLLPKNTLWIASIDFSHYLPKRMADFHDETSLAALSGLNVESVENLEIDSRPGLRLFLNALNQHGAQTFHLLRHSNAADLVRDENLAETTSHFTATFSLGAKKPQDRITILAFGDLMLDRYVRQRIEREEKTYPFQPLERALMGNDIVLANLEGCFTTNAPKALHPNNTTFTVDPEMAPILRRFGFDLLSLANNHTLDFGSQGFSQCQDILRQNNIDFFGDPQNKVHLSTIKEIRGKNIAFIGYNQFRNPDSQIITDEITRVRQESDFIIVMPHWGNEYQTTFSSSQQEKGRQWIDAGADIILGSHPHVAQPIEVYRNRPIFYSIGNGLFDQTFSEETEQGLSVGAVIRPDGLDVSLFPITSSNQQMRLADPEKRDKLLLRIAEDSVVPEEMQTDLLNGKLRLAF